MKARAGFRTAMDSILGVAAELSFAGLILLAGVAACFALALVP